MRVLGACSLGGAGHLNPLLPLLDAARRAGHDTLVVAPPAMTEMVVGTGHPFFAGGEPLEEEIAPIRERLATAPAAEASVLGNRDLFGRLATVAMQPRMDEAFAAFEPDLVLREPCEYASAVAGHRLGIPTAQVAISVAEAEEGAIEVAGPALEEQRTGLTADLLATPYLTRFPASLDPSPFPTTVRFREAAPAHGRALPDWWDGAGGPLVYLTFGTVLGFMTMAADIYRIALDTVARLDARVLLTVGRKFDPALLGDVPAHVHVERWVDQADVLTQADVVVCHGGSGTVYGSVAAGVPLVVVPMFADQFENGRRVASRGAGLVVEVAQDTADGPREVIGPDDAPRIESAIAAVIGDGQFRAAASEIADEMAATPTADEVIAGLLSPEGVRALLP